MNLFSWFKRGHVSSQENSDSQEAQQEPQINHCNSDNEALDEEELAFQAFQEEETLRRGTKQIEKPLEVAVTSSIHTPSESGEAYAPELDLPEYQFQTLDLLEDLPADTIAVFKDELEANKVQIEKTLNSLGITIQRIAATIGPNVTLYEIVPTEGVRISRIKDAASDIAVALSLDAVEISPIVGKGTIGIQVPNRIKRIVIIRELLSAEKFINSKMSLPIGLGKRIDNENCVVDLAAMLHLLICGASGQGKSTCIHSILVSLLYKKHPSQLKFVLIDPKKVELSVYRLIEKHFLAKLPNGKDAIITDTSKVINTLNALCIEMDNRYELLKEAGTRNIKEYNEKFIARRLNSEKGHCYLPFIVLVVDEFADLIRLVGKEIESAIAHLAQSGSRAGIHLIIATAFPSGRVLKESTRVHFTTRIVFRVPEKNQSIAIINQTGAEELFGNGDMLMSTSDEIVRLQGSFVSSSEIHEIVNFIEKQPAYPHAFELPEYFGEDDGGVEQIDLTNLDKLFKDCARIVVSTQSGSTSNLQRKFNLGYNRAGRIMDQLEAAGIVGPAVGSRPREVLYGTEMELEQFLETLQ